MKDTHGFRVARGRSESTGQGPAPSAPSLPPGRPLGVRQGRAPLPRPQSSGSRRGVGRGPVHSALGSPGRTPGVPPRWPEAPPATPWGLRRDLASTHGCRVGRRAVLLAFPTPRSAAETPGLKGPKSRGTGRAGWAALEANTRFRSATRQTGAPRARGRDGGRDATGAPPWVPSA